jgi:hypothetical protein
MVTQKVFMVKFDKNSTAIFSLKNLVGYKWVNGSNAGDFPARIQRFVIV